MISNINKIIINVSGTIVFLLRIASVIAPVWVNLRDKLVSIILFSARTISYLIVFGFAKIILMPTPLRNWCIGDISLIFKSETTSVLIQELERTMEISEINYFICFMRRSGLTVIHKPIISNKIIKKIFENC
ncbi:hypothetical protein Glove_255g5 [Diversispora epigaea]|uniref:Uncharacterized protein n=1 Tax=Diversispora epigaea TaxID=1348612 RepID=A0A397I7K6_9GLOM|nr:hypothetical protein Glove_255g5 [Diversispora epigaea]